MPIFTGDSSSKKSWRPSNRVSFTVMKILISGGTGLVGCSLVDALVSAGHSCQVLSRTPDRQRGFPSGVTLERWDARSSEPLVTLLDQSDAVVHLCGESIGEGRWTAERKRRILDSRVDSSRAMTEAIELTSTPPSVFVQASAVGFYGPCGDEEITDEASPGEDFLASVCRQWEAASARLDGSSVRRVVIRTGIVLTSEGGALPRMALPFKLFAGGPAGSGGQWMPWIHLADEVGAIRFAIENEEARGPLNLSAPQPVTNRDFSRVLGKALHRPSFMPAPAFALRMALGEMADLILTGQKAVPKRLLDLGFYFKYPELSEALNDIYS